MMDKDTLQELHNEVVNATEMGQDCSEEPVGGKRVLYTRGAQKLCKLFNLSIDVQTPTFFQCGDAGGLMLISSVVVCLRHAGEIVGSGVGAAVSAEKMFRHVSDGKYRMKPDGPNAMVKMASNRALVAAFINTTATGELFTQDVQARKQNGDVPVPEGAPSVPLPAAEPPANGDMPMVPPVPADPVEKPGRFSSGEGDPLVDVNKRKSMNHWYHDARYSEAVKKILGDKHWAQATNEDYQLCLSAVMAAAKERIGK